MRNNPKIENKSKKSKILSLVALLCVTCAMLCSTSCSLISFGASQAPQQVVEHNIIINQADKSGLPDYVADLVKLDEVFKAYSYSGYDEEAFGEMLLKYYIAATGDMYAEYMNAEEYEAYNSESAGEFVGVGISVIETFVEISGYKYKTMQVISVFENSPALDGDVKVGDYVMFVGGGDDAELVDELGYDKALSKMRGEEGTIAKFTVYRPDKNEVSGFKIIEFELERKKVITESVRFRVSESDSKVGIVNVTGFDQTTATQFKKAINTLKNKGCEYFVFDVRNNPGGALLSIEAVLSYFLQNNDIIIGVEYGDGTTAEDYVMPVYYGPQYDGFNVAQKEIGMYRDLKCVVLTNDNTASAAELFTATFRDYGLAKVVGTTTYGKGCMQTIIPLEEYGLEGGLRVTTAMYFSKSRHIYHEIGIEPDYVVELPEEAYEYNFFVLPEELDTQLQKAIEVVKGEQ